MTEYLVAWCILVEAETPEEAARVALAAQRSADSTATCFDVYDEAGRRDTIVCPTCAEPGCAEDRAPARPHLKLVKTSRA
jgi:hypothetical protein